MKKSRNIIYIAALLLTLSLSSCGDGVEKLPENVGNMLVRVKTDVKWIASEMDDIVEIVKTWDEAGEATPRTLFVQKTAEDTAMFPLAVQKTRTSVPDSPYNSWNSAATALSCGADVELTEDNRESLPAEATFGCARIERFADRSLAAVEGALVSFGIKTEVIRRSSTAPAGEVFAMTYSGVCDGEAYYINPGRVVTLYVSAEKPVPAVTNPRKVVYLTYDDGPTKNGTGRLLDVLDTYGIKAAFFTVGDFIKNNPDSARAVVERGHYLGCHSVTHEYKKIYASVESLASEIREWEKIVSDLGITQELKLFRFPGGSVGEHFDQSKRDDMITMLHDMGYLAYDWNVVTNDALLSMRPEELSSKEYIKETFLDTFATRVRINENGSDAPIIILMHETTAATTDLMPWMIEYLLSEGYTFGDFATLGGSWMFGMTP